MVYKKYKNVYNSYPTNYLMISKVNEFGFYKANPIYQSYFINRIQRTEFLDSTIAEK